MAGLREPKPSYRKVVAALAESEERYRTLVEGVRQYAIFMLNPAGIILTWNRGIQELLGYTRDEIVGQSGEIVFSDTDRAAGAFKKELAQAKRSGESIKEHLNCHKDRTEVRVHDTATALLNAKGGLIGFAKVSRRSNLPLNPEAEAIAQELAKALGDHSGRSRAPPPFGSEIANCSRRRASTARARLARRAVPAAPWYRPDDAHIGQGSKKSKRVG